MNKFNVVIGLMSILLLFHPVHAQEEMPENGDDSSVWGEVVTVNGILLFDEMIDLGVIQQDVTWMEASIMGNDVLDATYHVYQTSNGNMVYLPDAMTLAYMAASPAESGFANASMLAEGDGIKISTLGTIVGGDVPSTESMDSELVEILSKAWSNPENFFYDVLNGKSPAFTGIGESTMNALIRLLSVSYEDLNYYTAILVFDDCTVSPLGCLDVQSTPTPLPTQIPTIVPTQTPPKGCPASQVTTQSIQATIELVAPEYPLVVGQDPERRGADIMVDVMIPPTTYTYYVRVPIFEEQCVLDESTNMYSCEDVIIDWKCEKQVKVYSDPIADVIATANLTQDSREWIENGLSESWYEANVQQPNHSLIPGLQTFSSSCNQLSQCGMSQFIANIPFVDPGYYNLGLSIWTMGTPVSSPRHVVVEDTAQIWATFVALKDN